MTILLEENNLTFLDKIKSFLFLGYGTSSKRKIENLETGMFEIVQRVKFLESENSELYRQVAESARTISNISKLQKALLADYDALVSEIYSLETHTRDSSIGIVFPPIDDDDDLIN
jgi:hypothetical protein